MRVSVPGPPRVIDTVYLGGGTPSLLSLQELEDLFQHIRKRFSLTTHTEITIEVNPESITPEKLTGYRELGIGRISIGIQSFLEQELRYLGRIHSVAQAKQAFNQARKAGFENISIDLIYALPEQTLDEWQYSLDHAMALRPEHISAYGLIFEDGTPFGEMLLKNRIRAKSSDEEYDFFSMTMASLEANGYRQYEISNYAISDNYRSRHNLKYWDHSSYLGFGPSAHSFVERSRWSNIRSVEAYVNQLGKGLLPVDFSESLDEETIRFESIFLSLRTVEGIDLRGFEKNYGRSFTGDYPDLVRDLVEAGYALLNDNHFRLTPKGLCLCDEIIPNFIPV